MKYLLLDSDENAGIFNTIAQVCEEIEDRATNHIIHFDKYFEEYCQVFVIEKKINITKGQYSTSEETV